MNACATATTLPLSGILGRAAGRGSAPTLLVDRAARTSRQVTRNKTDLAGVSTTRLICRKDGGRGRGLCQVRDVTLEVDRSPSRPRGGWNSLSRKRAGSHATYQKSDLNRIRRGDRR